MGFRVFFYDNYYYTVAVFFISARIRITVLIVTGTLIHLGFGNYEDIDKNIIIDRCKLNETYE